MTSSIADAELKTLAKEVKGKFDVALKEKDAFFYASEKVTLQESEHTGICWQIRTVPALLKKSKASSEDTKKREEEEKEEDEEGDKRQQNKDDVFAPPYVPNLHVKDLGDHHVILLNKFCVVPQHFLMVTREFASQELPPSPATLTLAYRVVMAHKAGAAGTELLGFYNCGATAGASQPHRHLQFVQCPPLDTTSDDAVETGRLTEEEREKIVESEYKVPVEVLLERIERDGKEEDSVHALPLPWQHFVSLLSPSAAVRSDEAELERYVGNKFMMLLDAMFRARMFANDDTNQHGRPAFNVLITKRAMHVIPRSHEEYQDLPKADKVGDLSINSLGYAGFMLSRSLEEQQALDKVEGGVEEVLRKTGVEPVADVTVQGGLPTTNM